MPRPDGARDHEGEHVADAIHRRPAAGQPPQQHRRHDDLERVADGLPQHRAERAREVGDEQVADHDARPQARAEQDERGDADADRRPQRGHRPVEVRQAQADLRRPVVEPGERDHRADIQPPPPGRRRPQIGEPIVERGAAWDRVRDRGLRALKARRQDPLAIGRELQHFGVGAVQRPATRTAERTGAARLTRLHAPVEVRRAVARRAHGEAVAPSSSALPNVTVEGSRIGFLKRTSDAERGGQPAQRGEAARLRPHPVRDRAREAEQLRRPGVQVDRVAVARRRRRSGGRGRRAGATARSAGGSGGASSAGGVRSPPPSLARFVDSPSQTSSSPTRASRDDRERAAARVRLERRRPDAHRQRLAEPQRPVLDDPVGDVDERRPR